MLNYANFGEAIKQWTAVLALPTEPASTSPDTPFPRFTKTVYGKDGWFEAYSAAGVTHDIGNHEDVALAWFDLTCTGEKCFRWGQGGPAGDSLKASTVG